MRVPGLRIAMISEPPSRALDGHEPERGGRELHVNELSAALVAAGHEVRIYHRHGTSTVVSEPVEALGEGVSVERVLIGPKRATRLLPALNEFGHQLERRWSGGEFSPDVVHAHGWTSGLAAVAAMSNHRQPLVVTFHAPLARGRRADDRPRAEEHRPGRIAADATRPALERMLGRCADRVVALTNDEVTELVRADVPRRRIALVPSGVDTVRFQPAGSALPLASGPWRWRILVVGRQFGRGGVADVVAALRHVPDTELVIAGGPPPAALDRDTASRRLLALCEHARVADRVRLLGAVPEADMPALYRAVDIVACAPSEQPFGIVPLEAMASARPVVAYATGGLRETVIDGVTGVLVRPRDTRALAIALRRLLGDDLRRMGMASAAVDRIHARYAWPRLCEAIERVYADAIAEAAETSAAETSAAAGRPELTR
jgi:glycosyltransferase involved in cell wall biosynthesis